MALTCLCDRNRFSASLCSTWPFLMPGAMEHALGRFKVKQRQQETSRVKLAAFDANPCRETFAALIRPKEKQVKVELMSFA